MKPRAFVFSDSAYAGGAESYLRSHLRAAGPDNLGVVAIARPGLRDWLSDCEREGFDVHRLAPGTLMTELRELRSWIREWRPRLLHFNLPGPYDSLRTLGPVIARRGGVHRIIVTEHLPSVGRVGKRFWVKRLARGSVDRAICVCQAHRSWLRDVFGYSEEQIRVVPNGVADPRSMGAPLKPPRDLVVDEEVCGPRVIQVGSLDRRKGASRLIEAVARLRDSGVDLRLWLVGDGPERGVLESMVERLAVRDRVRLTGARSDAAALFAHADIAALASEREGMPLSLLEAAAWGRAILTTTVDGCPEVVDDGRAGVLVRPGDVDALCRELASLAADTSRRHVLGARARVHYERNHREELMTARTFSHYGQLAEGWLQ